MKMHIYKISLLPLYSCNYKGHEWDYRYASSFVYPINKETLSALFHGDSVKLCDFLPRNQSYLSTDSSGYK